MNNKTTLKFNIDKTIAYDFDKYNLKVYPSYELVKEALETMSKNIKVCLATAHKTIGSTYVELDAINQVNLYNWLSLKTDK